MASGSTKRTLKEEPEGPEEKKACIDEEDNIFAKFPEKLIKRLANICEHYLCCPGDYNEPILRTLEFTNCNGADANGGVPFSKAYCSVRPIKGKHQVFGSVFTKGLDMLLQYLERRRIPDNLQERFILKKLLHYLVDAEIQSPLLTLEEFGETDDLSIVFANHLFGQLSASSRYIIDKNSTGKKKNCPCAQGCGMPCNFGDTSIGNEEVWHGNLDVIINKDVVINPIGTESSPGKTSGEVKIRSTSLTRSPQIISQTVVFSFLQKQSHPESMHSLFPCIGVAKTGLVIYFYDSVHDVLLESSRIPLHVDVKEAPYTKVSLTAILVSWLAVNYKYLCSGLPESLKSTAKAGFFVQAKDKLQIYISNLKLGNVGCSTYAGYSEDSDSDVDTPDYLSEIRSKFYCVARGTDLGRDRSLGDST